ncbi:hypothetical protein ACIGO8_21995 [Streptomyces sp. NPDC053493]|uniref:hypothetical protein n=1 Tax=Streptomyces sp. NPDC053493 TaxID=3365705 RepID=UPI0037D883B7
MTTPTLPAPATAPAAPVSPLRRTLRALAMLACLPYIVLKIAWVAGSTAGIPEGSVLLDHPTATAVANGISVIADAIVVLLALLLTRPWGLRVRAWLLLVPVWAATGLIAPIMAGYPAQLVVALLVPSRTGPAVAPVPDFLDPWVFPVVYGGFIVQGLSLGTLFVLYSRDRWGRVRAGRLGELPAAVSGAGVRACTVAAAALALAPAGLHVLWACGMTGGLAPDYADGYDSDQAVVDVVRAFFLVVAGLAGLALALRRPAGLRVRTATATAWVASGAAGCWGAYMTLVALMPQTDGGKEPTLVMAGTYAVEMIIGFLLAGCLAVILNRRSRTA